MPLGFAVATTEPLMLPRGSLGLLNSVDGRVATYITPGGLFSTTEALPSAPVVMFCALAQVRSAAKETERMVVANILQDVMISLGNLQFEVVEEEKRRLAGDSRG